MGVWKGKKAESISVLEYGWTTAAWALCTNTRLRARRNMGKSARKGSGSCCLLLNDWSSYYDYQFSNARQKVWWPGPTCVVFKGNQLRFHWQLVGLLTSLATQRAGKLLMTILLMETRNVSRGNNVILSQNFVSKAPSPLTQLIIPSCQSRLYFQYQNFTLKVSCSRSSDWKTYRFPSISLRSSLSLNKWTDEWITKQSRRINESGNRGMITEY